MRFGVVFAILVMVLGGGVMLLAARSAETTALALASFAAGVVCLNAALGLMLRQRWARWAALLAALVLVAMAGLILQLASFVALLLLVIPATGQVEPASERKSIALLTATGLGFVALAVAFGWGLLQPSASAAPSEAPIQIAGLSPRIAWQSYEKALQRAEEASKPVVLVFETAWCGYCQKMNRTTFKDAAVVERLNTLPAAKINAEKEVALASRFGVAGYPTLVLLSPEGRVLARRSGYLSASDFLAWIDQAT